MQVRVAQPPQQNVTEARTASRSRLGAFFSGAWKVTKMALKPLEVIARIPLAVAALGVGVATAGAGLAGAVVGGALGAVKGLLPGQSFLKNLKAGALKGADLGVGAIKLPFEVAGRILEAPGNLGEACRCRATSLPDELTQNNPRGILHKQVGGQSVEQVMTAYCQSIDSPVTPREMRAYINSGERIADAINMLPEDYDGGPIEIQMGDQTVKVSPNTDTLRALSWYMMSKAASSQSGNGNTLEFGRGSMVMKDPGNKMFKFMKSAPTTYGRISTHFEERSLSPKGFFSRFAKGGILAMIKKQPLQFGVEDFDCKMPSGKGCLLFDRMHGGEGRQAEQQIFFKWESAGVPTATRLTGHTDGWNPLTALGHGLRSVSRCISHAGNFIKSRGDVVGPDTSRREAVNKGTVGQMVFTPFTQFIESLGLPDATSSSIVRQAKTNGMYWIEDYMSNVARPLPEGVSQAFDATMNGIQTYKRDLAGPDVGIQRRGGEVHIDVSTDYLHP
jgi:hypothetical protein